MNGVFNTLEGRDPTCGDTLGGVLASAGAGCVTGGISSVIGGSLKAIGATAGERVIVQGTLLGITGVTAGVAGPAIDGSRDPGAYTTGIVTGLAGAAPIVPSGSDVFDSLTASAQQRVAQDALTGGPRASGCGPSGSGRASK